MKKKYQMPEMHRVGLNIQIGPELAGASDEALMEQMKSGGYYENKICYRANPNFVAREIAGELLLIPVKDQAQKLNGMVRFSETGTFLWERLSQKRQTRDDLVVQLAAEYRKQQEEVREDVDSFLESALKKELILKELI